MSWDRYARPVESLLDAIGHTPLLRLARVAPDLELFAKVEWYGPTGSVKDRIYAHMLAKAEARWASATRHDDHRVHDRQRRHRVRGGRCDQGLRLPDRDAARG